MAITGAIPLPSSGLEGFFQGAGASSTLLSQMIQRRAQQEQMDRLRQMLPLEKQFKQAQIGHLGASDAMLPLQRMLMMEQLKKAQMENDPEAQLNYLQRIMSGLSGMQSGGTSGGQMMPEDNGMPTPDASQGMSAPSGMPDMANLAQNPYIAGFLKNKFGIDLNKETPQAKEQRAVNQAVNIDQAKANRKKIDDIEATARALMPHLNEVQTIEQILQNKPDLTGRTTGWADTLGMTKDEDVGRFLSAAQKLQAQMAKELSSRGGYGVSRLVEQAKPNISKSGAYNKGVIKELKQSMKESFTQMNDEYKRLTGKKLPYDFEQYFKESVQAQQGTQKPQGNLVPIISPSGKKVMIPSDQVDAALAAGGRRG